MDIKSSIETLVAHGIPMQDIMASAILNNARDIVAEIAKIDPEAVCMTVSWEGYACEDGLSCTELMCHAHRPSLYRAYVENAACIPPDFEEVCYEDEYDNARTDMMKVGIQINNAMLVDKPTTAVHLREAAINYIKDRAYGRSYDDLRVYVDETLNKVGDRDGDEALGWFFLDAMEVLIGSKIENAWTIAHPKPTEDIV